MWHKVRATLRWGIPVLATIISLLVGQSLKWRLTSEIVLAFAAGAFTFGVAWLLIYFGALELRHQKAAVILALVPAVVVFGIFARASGFWGFVAVVTGEEAAGKAEATVEAASASFVATPKAQKCAEVRAATEVPGLVRSVVEGILCEKPTPTNTLRPGETPAPTATPTPKPGQIPVLVGELSPRDWEKAGVTPTVEPVFETVVLQLLEPEGTLVATSQRAETGGAGRYFFSGEKLEKNTKYQLKVIGAPNGFDTTKVKLWNEKDKKLEDSVFIYKGEGLTVIIFRKE